MDGWMVQTRRIIDIYANVMCSHKCNKVSRFDVEHVCSIKSYVSHHGTTYGSTFCTTVIEPPYVAEITGTVSNYFGILRYLDQATPCTTGFHPSFDVLPVEISPCPLGCWVGCPGETTFTGFSLFLDRALLITEEIHRAMTRWWRNQGPHYGKWTYEANRRSVFAMGCWNSHW